MKSVRFIMRRELAGYFSTPIAYVVLVIFLLIIGGLTFGLGGLFESGQASLTTLFVFLPWTFLFLIPAVSMRLWAEERRSGTIELLLTQPVTLWQAVLGKFLAAWLFIAVAIALTFPMWVTVNILGDPDNGTIFAGYIGSFFFAGGFLAVGSFTSAITKNQLIAFLVALLLCLILLLIGFPFVVDLFRDRLWPWLVDGMAALSFYEHFQNIGKGVLDLRDVLYFTLVISFFLLASTVVLDARKSN